MVYKRQKFPIRKEKINMKMIYNVEDRPKLSANLVFAFQQLLSIIAATLLVPVLVNSAAGKTVLDQAAALFGAGAGTLIYIMFTKMKSPVYLGSSFAFISPLIGACSFGYFVILLGAIFAGLVYVVLAIIVKLVGTKWVDKLLPPVIIGPTVALIGLSLCGSAIDNVTGASAGTYNLIQILCGLIAFGATVLASVKGKKTAKLIPFIIGVGAGYVAASLFTLIGNVTGNEYLQVIDFSPIINNFKTLTIDSFIRVPGFLAVSLKEELITNGTDVLTNWQVYSQIALLFVPVAFVVFAEHIADHKNLSTVIDRDLIKDPGLSNTLLGDGVGSIVGSIFGGCPNTTYGESVGCVAITRNASVSTIIIAAIYSMVLSFFTPFVVFVNTIPSCVIGGICIALYGFIAVSGLKMIQTVDLNESRNLFVVSSILVTGIGGLTLNFGDIQITSIATALILGILTNFITKGKQAKAQAPVSENEVANKDEAQL